LFWLRSKTRSLKKRTMRGKQFHLPFLHGSFDLPHFFSLSTFHSAGFQARSTNVHLFRCSVYLNSYRFDVGFPHFVCSSMRMAHIVSEMSAFFTNCTLCHDRSHLLKHYNKSGTRLTTRPATKLFYQKLYKFAREK